MIKLWYVMSRVPMIQQRNQESYEEEDDDNRDKATTQKLTHK